MTSRRGWASSPPGPAPPPPLPRRLARGRVPRAVARPSRRRRMRRGPVGCAGDGELHLVAVAVGIRGPDDRPQLEGAETAEAFEAVRDLLGLEGELCRIGDVLKAAAAATTEVGARGSPPAGRRAPDPGGDPA